ncbi:MAG: alpha/beta hydrolase [Pseudomonadota bacterium]
MVSPANSKECVVLLHGLARSSTSLLLMEWRLKREGYETVNLSYPSKDDTIEKLAEATLPAALVQCKDASRVHFVTHSMGGILLRYWMKDPGRRPAHLGQSVMLGPPNQGSPVVDQMTDLPGFELWNGPAGIQLGTDDNGLPRTLGPVDWPLGIIAGNQSVSPILSAMMDEENDGKVPVSSTRVDGMADHIVMPVTHTFMMNNPRVQDQVIAFLKAGQFARD